MPMCPMPAPIAPAAGPCGVSDSVDFFEKLPRDARFLLVLLGCMYLYCRQMRVGRSYVFLRRLVTTSAVIGIVCGCASFPAPESPDDSLLLVPVGVEKSTDGEWYGEYRIFVSKYGTNEVVTTFRPTPGARYALVDGLEPGRYYISQDHFRYDRGSTATGTTRNLRIPFSLRPGEVTVLGVRFVYIMEASDTPGWIQMNRRWDRVTVEEYDALREHLRGLGNADKWEIRFFGR